MEDAKKVFLICEMIDLGYHVIKAKFSFEEAEKEVERLNQEDIKNAIKRFMAIGYSEENAMKQKLNQTARYHVEQVEVD